MKLHHLFVLGLLALSLLPNGALAAPDAPAAAVQTPGLPVQSAQANAQAGLTAGAENALAGSWKYECNGQCYEREFRADGTVKTYVYAGPEVPILKGYTWKIEDNQVVVSKAGEKSFRFEWRDHDHLDFAAENGCVAARDAASIPFPTAPASRIPRHAEICARAAKGDVDVVFLGDSITHCWETNNTGKPIWDREIAPLKAANFGIGGDHTENVLWRLDNGALPAAFHPKVAVLMIGTNNTGYHNGSRMESPEMIAAGITAIVDRLHRHDPKTRILLLAIFPRGATPADRLRQNNEAVNRIIAKLDGQMNVRFQDIGAKFLAADGSLSRKIAPDLLHLSAEGYQIWADAILPEIKKTLSEKQ